MKANNTWATNTITHPERIVPVKSTASIKGERVAHVMPAYSIQVVQIDLK
jgi:alpha-L-arabinofuranosidase